jgi:1-deoxy-D-xylulose-5-phosphate synthase
MRFVKPLDGALLAELLPAHRALVTLEEGCVAGGAGSAVCEWLDAAGLAQPRLQIGIPDEFIGHGSRSACLRDAGLDAGSVGARVRKWWLEQPELLNTPHTAPRLAILAGANPV